MYNKPMLSLDQVQRAMPCWRKQRNNRINPSPLPLWMMAGSLGELRPHGRGAGPSPSVHGRAQGVHRGVVGPGHAGYADRLKSQGRTVAEMGDPNLAAVQGGLVVLHAETGTIMGELA